MAHRGFKQNPAQKGTVYLVGAGPGDPEMLTLRAAHLLATADVVLHDDLVAEAVLAMCGDHTLLQSVGKRCGEPRVTQAGIHALLIDAVRQGLSVVRLKSGDPLVFGRAAEELAALREAGILVEIIPGISAVFAAGAALQVPFTDRRTASKLILIAGQHAANKSDPAPLWEGPLPHDATLAIYMPGRTPALLAEKLLKGGVAPTTPCVAISRAGTPDQQIAVTRLQELAHMKIGAAPLLILAGEAMEPCLHATGSTSKQAVDDVLTQVGLDSRGMRSSTRR